MAQKDSGLAIGIDLGTTYSCVGVWRSGRVEILPNEVGLKKTPSYVAFPDTGRRIGEEAKSRAAFNSTKTIFNIKRLMGRRPFDRKFPVGDIKKLWPFEVISEPQVQRRYMIRVNYRGEDKLFSPEEISSMVLAKMRDIAEAYLGTTARNAVISVPACFNTAQRQATMDAGAIAGLNVMRLINEPSAAALAYGFVRDVGWEGKKNILVFDLGGGTLDVSLLNIDEGTFKVMSTEGDTCLGGEDFDDAMVDYFIERFKEKHKRDISCSSRAVMRLKAACEKAKIALTVTKETTIEIDRLYEEIDFSATITRSLFEKLNNRLLMKCKEIVAKCLRNGKVSPRHIDEVLLVGGSTRIPMVQEMLIGYFGMELCKAINADEAVAYGATLQAAMLTREGNEEMPKLALEDVTALDFNIFVNGTNQKTAFPKNTAIPPVKPFIFPWDKCVHFLDVYEDKDNYFLERLRSQCEFAPNARARFYIDENGILSVSIQNTNTKQKTMVSVPTSRLNRDEIKRMAQDAEVYNFQEEEHKNRVKEKNSLEKYIYDSRKAINDKMIETKLDSADKKRIEVAIENRIEWLATHQLVPAEEYRDKMVELQNVCGHILNKIREEEEQERSSDLSPNRGAGPSVKASDCGCSSINCISKANPPQSDDITESNISSEIIIHPINDADEVYHGSPELVVESFFLNDGATSKIGITFPPTNSKVEFTSETKLTICNNVDTALLPKILSKLREWAVAVAQNTYNELVRMLHAKSEHRSFPAIAGADSQSQDIKRPPPDDSSACAETTEAATHLDGGATHNMEIKGHSPGAGVGSDNHPSNCGGTDHEEKEGHGAVAETNAEGSPSNSRTQSKGDLRDLSPNGGSSMADQVSHTSSPDANFGSGSTLSDENPGNNASSGNQDDVSTKELHVPTSNIEGEPDPETSVSSASDGQDEMARANDPPTDGGLAGTVPPGQNSSA